MRLEWRGGCQCSSAAICGYVLYLICANGFGLGKAIDFSRVAAAPLFGWPKFTHPVFTASAVGLIAPVAILLVAENLGHVKAIAAMTGRDFDPLLGRAFLADGLATVIAGSGGGTGVTNYAENMGVMAVTRVFFHARVCRGRNCRPPARLLAEIRRSYHDLTGAGD